MTRLVDPPFVVELYSIVFRGGARLSFQRFRLPDRALLIDVPSSLGVLPCAPHGDGAMVPLARGEALWVGCLPAFRAEYTQVTMGRRPDDEQDAGLRTAVSVEPPETLAIAPGLRLADGTHAPIRRRSRRDALAIEVATRWQNGVTMREAIDVGLVTPARFEAETGVAVPGIDDSAGWRGSLLP